MRKFGRNYRLLIDAENILLSDALRGASSEIVIEINPPFTMEFNIERNILSSANTSNIRVFNLSKERRGQIHKDQYASAIYKGVELKAGYGDTMPTIFKGNISFSWSAREGNNIITTIEAYDGGFALVNAQTNQVYKAGTSRTSVLNDLQKGLVKVEPGVIGNFPGTLSRGNSLNGNSAQLLSEVTENSFFIDLETSHMLGENETLRGQLPVLTAESGLLSTPKRQNTIITFDMLFEPRLVIGQALKLEGVTTIDPALNTDYKVVSLHHRGVISDAVSANAVTTVGLWFGTQELRTIN